jgi:hypothetical protein
MTLSIRRLLPILPLLLTGGVTARAASNAQLLCRFQDTAINESSGLAASSRSNEYFFTHNDSGDKARFFAVDRRGRTLATFRVPGADNEDWEDMARGRDAAGRPVLLFGDIGDNHRERDDLCIYQVPEPEVDRNRTGVKADTERPIRFDIRYADGPHDAETLLCDLATGRIFVVTKSLRSSGVYASKGRLRANAPNVLTKVSWVRFMSLPATTAALSDQLGRLLATGGDISPDGDRVVVRTYTDAYEWKITGSDVAAAFRAKPTRLPLPHSPQGEAAAYRTDGESILFSSEKRNAPVHELVR